MNLKYKLNHNIFTVGSWLTLNSSETAELMCQFPFDWLTVDVEHSSITLSDLQSIVRTVQGYKIPVLVRVENNDVNVIKRVMDIGPEGIIVPMVKSKEEAEQAVASVKYPPQGKRGVGLARAQRYGLSFKEYKVWNQKESIVGVIIEHVDAIENLEEILSVEGVDFSMIGPYDLSGSMGYPGEFKRPDVKKAIAYYLKVCKKLKKTPGFHIVPPDIQFAQQKIKEGFRFIAFSTDAQFLTSNIKETLSKIKK